jgi:hypothetical protein
MGERYSTAKEVSVYSTSVAHSSVVTEQGQSQVRRVNVFDALTIVE